MKKKLYKIWGVGLALVLAITLSLGLAVPAGAADYPENDWDTWGLPAVSPNTDVGPLAVAPDGTLFAAIQGQASLLASGNGSSSWSTSNALAGDYSAELIGGVQTGSDWAGVSIWVGGTMALSDVTEFIYNYTFDTGPGDGYGPHMCFYTHDPNDGETGEITLYSGVPFPASNDFYGNPYGGTPGQTGLNTVTVTPATTGFGWFGSESESGFAQGFGTNARPLSDYQTATGFEDHVVDRIAVEYGWWSSGDASEPAYVDDVSLNSTSIEIESSSARVVQSTDGGFTWDDTELDDVALVADIAISPNYTEDQTIYVGCFDGSVWRVEEGESPIVLKVIRDSGATTVSSLYSIDVWNDGDDNWIMAGTNLDVLVLRDAPFGTWIDQELNAPGFEVNFAPDFDDSQLVWAMTDDGLGDFLLTSTVAPGQWGQVIDDALFTGVGVTNWLDIDFPDDYTSDVGSDVPIVYAALSDSGSNGGVYMVECVADDGDATPDSIATALMTSEDMVSLDISGEVILAGALNSPTVYKTEDLGWSWGDGTKNPTGSGLTYVVMAPGAFDPDDGTAYACTTGTESAVSRSDDGGEIWNQIGLIDTYIDDIEDLAFNPDFPATPTYLMITENSTTANTYSLWITENGDVDSPDYQRVLCGYVPGAPGNFAGEWEIVTYTPDGDTIFLGGWDASDYTYWRSTNGGDTFGSKRVLGDGLGYINDWAMPDDDTLIACTSNGVWRTVNGGLSWTQPTATAMASIVLSPDYDNDSTVLIGGQGGEVGISGNSGASFTVDTPLSSWTYVAFGPGFAGGEGDIFAADANGGNPVIVGDEDLDFNDLEADATGAHGISPDFSAGALLVSPDNTLYAIDYNTLSSGGVYRLLLDEDGNVWESAEDGDLVNSSWRGWLTPGNVIWTIDWADAELWVLADTLSGQVTLSSPADGFRTDSEDTVALAWNEMTGADDYELDYGVAPLGDLGTSTTLNNLDDATEYTWMVRVEPGAPWSSRWSDSRTFHTALGVPPWSPTPYAPGNGATGVSLLPAFSWETASQADGYQFQLNDSPVFATLVDVEVTTEAYQVTTELEYGTTYYWRVRALKGNDAISRWSEVSVFTTMEEGADPPTPVTTITTTEAPPPVVLPTAIPPALLWTIIGIGALLIIAVIVLIVRTRRAV
ncbi:WD40/YVTN/BNR-like repeat-containing protein [Chloroflexota bacterium]